MQLAGLLSYELSGRLQVSSGAATRSTNQVFSDNSAPNKLRRVLPAVFVLSSATRVSVGRFRTQHTQVSRERTLATRLGYLDAPSVTLQPFRLQSSVDVTWAP